MCKNKHIGFTFFLTKKNHRGKFPTWFYLKIIAIWLWQLTYVGGFEGSEFTSRITKIFVKLPETNYTLHQRVCLLGSLAFHCLASDEQSINSCLREDNSSRKTAPFLRFQSCQQHKATNMLCCCCGTAPTLIVEGISFVLKAFWGTGTPRDAQNSAAFAHWKRRCPVVSCGDP